MRKPIKDFPNYEIDTKGNVYNVNTGWKLRPRNVRNGYKQVLLYRNGKSTAKYVHVLVAETFIREKKKDEEVDHINHNRDDNSLTNLRIIKRQLNRSLQTKRRSIVEIINSEVSLAYLSLNSVKGIWTQNLHRDLKKKSKVNIQGRVFVTERSDKVGYY